MIVTCEQCTTQFQLDDAKVPERGVRVRCSRCKHAFFVKPQADAGDPVERVVEQAFDAAPVRDARPPGPLDEAPEESDWEFNHEPGDAAESPGDAFAAPAGADLAREAVDDLLGGAGDDLPDLDSETAPGLDDDVDSLLGDAGDAGDEAASGLQLDGDLSQGLEDAPDDDPLGGGPELADSPFGEAASELEPEPEPEPEPAPEPAPAPVAAAAHAEATLDSPENWDFFDGAGEAPAPLPSSARLAIGRIGRVPGAVPLRPPAELDTEPAKTAVWLKRLVHAVGWTAVALLALAGLYGGLGLGPTPRPAVSASQTLHVAGLELLGMRGSWIENAPGGPIYVVSGQLHNPNASVVTPGARLTLQVLDGRGNVLSGDAAALGAALPSERLRTGRPQELRAELAADARGRAWAPLAPGAFRDFQAVLAALPEGAARLQVVAQPVERPAPQPPAPPASEAS